MDIKLSEHNTDGMQARRQELQLLEDLLTSDVLTATLLCQEPLVILNSRRVRSLLPSNKSLQLTQM